MAEWRDERPNFLSSCTYAINSVQPLWKWQGQDDMLLPSMPQPIFRVSHWKSQKSHWPALCASKRLPQDVFTAEPNRTIEELSASEALQTPDYDPLARLRRSIMPESRSEMTGANLDLDVPHQMAFYRWCGFHTHIEYESGEIPKDHCMRQGPEGEWMDGDDAISLSVTKISGAAYSAKIDLNFVRGKKLSQIFEDLDNSVIPEEQVQRKAIEEASQRQHDRAARHKKKFADEKVMTAFKFADAIEPRNEEFETQQIEQREARKQGYSTIALTTSIERWLQGITTPSP
ncbi:MAG: hypothetical protein LQ352_004634 [Teloschistes flavicans]|nr:MAG: hypothetical protein LQ352_004634 [Teloschistes flavicans]